MDRRVPDEPARGGDRTISSQLKADVLVIGAGAVGACSALYLARAGASVLLVERSEPAAGASAGNAGLVVPSHVLPFASAGAMLDGLRMMLGPHPQLRVKVHPSKRWLSWWRRFVQSGKAKAIDRSMPAAHAFALESLRLHRELAAGIGGYGFAENGWLHLYRSGRALDAAIRAAARTAKAGVDSRLLDAGDAARLANVPRSAIAGGVYFPGDAQLSPARFVRGVVEAAVGSGVRLIEHARVSLRRSGPSKFIVVDDVSGATVTAETCVVAAGIDSVELSRPLGVDVPVEPAAGYSITVDLAPRIPLPLSLAEDHVVVTPMDDLVRFTCGLDLIGRDDRHAAGALTTMVAAARSCLGVDVPHHQRVWTGFRPLTPDSRPIVGRTARYPDLILATGHGTLGITLAPATGKLVADTVTGGQAPAWASVVAPARFGL